MSRKHFEDIARDIRARYETESQHNTGDARATARLAIETLARQLADTFASHNDRFDRNRFLRACGIN